MLVAGLILAIAGAASDNLGVVLQSSQARKLPPEMALSPSLLVRLAHMRVWLLGGALILVGFVAQTAALSQASLTVVQPAIVLGLVVLVIASARVLGQRPTNVQFAAIAALGGSVAGVAILSPQHETIPGAGALALISAIAAAAAGVPYIIHARTGRTVAPGALAVGAGAGYAGVALLTKAFSEALSAGHWSSAGMLGIGMLILGLGGFLLEESALSVGAPTDVAPLVLLLQVGAPVALDILVFGEGLPLGGQGVAFLACLAAAVVGGMTLARSRATSGFRQPGRGERAPAMDAGR